MKTLDAQVVHLEDLREWEDAAKRIIEELCNWHTLPEWRNSELIPILRQ